MRCRKVRSLLSAACSEELDVRQYAEVMEHVASCPSCKREYAIYASIQEGAREIPDEPISDDFNTRLLGRIAEERFAETRTKAYLPKRAPKFQWRSLVPVTVVAGLLAVVTLNVYQPSQEMSSTTPTANTPIHMDDRYLTTQPSSNPNVTVAMEDSWTLNQKLARTERLGQISQRLTSNRAFVNQLTSGTMVRSQTTRPNPGQFFQTSGGVTYYIYRVNTPTSGGESGQAY
ncbi:MAG: zf-HC2 domain-containing protein [candidate division Zixibacteria bacterium]|nr:zf-HC2 domain-containing protein [candidate division Zixibacteria bacterium]